jgi:GPH family glycoside/pentoside/hexuronide:cation symporter
MAEAPEIAPVAAPSEALAPGQAAAPASRDERLPLSRILTYTSPALGVGFMFFLVSLYLMKFSTDVLFIAPGAMGLIFGLSRIWDAVSDPLAGYLSDRTRTRLGRRRPWILASLVPAVLVYLMLWNPPRTLEGGLLVLWMALGVFGFYTAMTIFGVPHAALGAELSKSYDDRNRVFGWRHVSFNAGAFLALGGMQMLISSDDPRRTAAGVAIFAATVTAAMIVFSVLRVRERAEYQGRGAARPFVAFGDVLRNPHARLLIVVLLIEHLGVANISILTPYASHYLIGTPEKTTWYVLGYMVASISSVLIWVRLATRFGKKPLWLLSMSITGIAFGGMFFGGKGDWELILMLAILGGIGGGCGAVVGPSMQADVIDYDEYKTGQRKEGAYFAAWSFVLKGSMGITLMITGFALQFSGFVPNVEQTPVAEMTIRCLFALFPLTSCAFGVLLLSRYSLNRAEHAEIKAELEARREAAGPAGA